MKSLQQIERQKEMTMQADIVGILKDAGYAVVSGAENVERMIRVAADDSTEKRCSGWRVFPDGLRCEGCGECQPNAQGDSLPPQEVNHGH